MSERFEEDLPKSLDELKQAANEMRLDPYPQDPEDLIDKVYYPARDKASKERQEQGEH